MVKIPQHKVTKWDNFLVALFHVVFVQSGSKTFTAAVYSKFYKLIKEDLRKGLEYYLFVPYYGETIFFEIRNVLENPQILQREF